MEFNYKRLAENYHNLLKNDGYCPSDLSEDDDGDTYFKVKYEGMSYTFYFSKSDPHYVFIRLWNFFELKETPTDTVNKIAHRANKTSKCSKVFSTMCEGEPNMTAETGFLAYDYQADIDTLKRYIGMTHNVATNFYKAISE